MKKACTRCDKLLPLTGFYKKAGGKSGLASECKFCSNRRAAEWSLKNPQKIRAMRRKAALSFYYRNRNRILAERKEFNLKNHVSFIQKQREQRSKRNYGEFWEAHRALLETTKRLKKRNLV